MGEFMTFVEEVQAAFAVLISREHLGVTDESPNPSVMDIGVVLLDSAHTRVRVVREKGSVSVEVTATQDGGPWFDLRVILGALTDERELLTRNLGLDEQAALVTKHWSAISDACSPAKWPETLRRCGDATKAEVEAVAAWAQELAASKSWSTARVPRLAYVVELWIFLMGFVGAAKHGHTLIGTVVALPLAFLAVRGLVDPPASVSKRVLDVLPHAVAALVGIGLIGALVSVMVRYDERSHTIVFSSDMLGPPLPVAARPTDCDTAVNALIAQLSRRHARALGGMDATSIEGMNSDKGIGGAIRTRYGLTVGNMPLAASCVGGQDARDGSKASHEILVRAQRRLHAVYFPPDNGR